MNLTIIYIITAFIVLLIYYIILDCREYSRLKSTWHFIHTYLDNEYNQSEAEAEPEAEPEAEAEAKINNQSQIE